LSVYLEYRNSVLFVRENYPAWLAWTILIQFSRLVTKARAYPLGSSKAAFRGIIDGMRGRMGRPVEFLQYHNNSKGREN
jgi:hypothetical protein